MGDTAFAPRPRMTGVRLASSSTASKYPRYCSSPELNWKYSEHWKIDPKLPVTLTHTPSSVTSGSIGMQIAGAAGTRASWGESVAARASLTMHENISAHIQLSAVMCVVDSCWL